MPNLHHHHHYKKHYKRMRCEKIIVTRFVPQYRLQGVWGQLCLQWVLLYFSPITASPSWWSVTLPSIQSSMQWWPCYLVFKTSITFCWIIWKNKWNKYIIRCCKAVIMAKGVPFAEYCLYSHWKNETSLSITPSFYVIDVFAFYFCTDSKEKYV